LLKKELGKIKALVNTWQFFSMIRPLEFREAKAASWTDYRGSQHQQRGCKNSNGYENPWDKLNRISTRITSIEGVNRCLLWTLHPKPPATV